jgi:phosphomannomutase
VTVPHRELGSIFKAYDVRGVVPDELDEERARAIGAAFAEWSGVGSVAVGRDCRLSSPALAAAVSEGIASRGADVIDLGLASTDLLYFASGSLEVAGVMLTASHNPPEYNGLKFCLPGARPSDRRPAGRDPRERGGLVLGPGIGSGSITERDVLDAYVEHVLSFVDVEAMRPLTVVADTANGMGGLVVPPVFERLPMTLVHLFPELDGTFPNHPADPIDPENLRDLQREVLARDADVGLAFDGDADRVFLMDERAEGASGSDVTALVAAAILDRHPGETVVHNLICSWAVPR